MPASRATKTKHDGKLALFSIALLSAIAKNPEAAHGKGLTLSVAKLMGGSTPGPATQVYIALRRMREDGYVEQSGIEPGATASTPDFKLYKLTPQGKATLKLVRRMVGE